MSCNKRLPAAAVIGLALGATWLSAAAAPTPSFGAAVSQSPAAAQSPSSAPTTSRHVMTVGVSPAAQKGTGADASSFAAVATASEPAVASASLAGENTHLTLGEIDRLARNKVASSLRGVDNASQPAAPAATKSAVAEVHQGPAVSPLAYAPRARTEPVSFFGAYVDGEGQHVLYQYNGAVYGARVGEKLLNGWTARAVRGQLVSVAEGKRTWSVAMKGDAMTPAPTVAASFVAGGVPLLGDLSRPLPPAMLASPTN